MIFAAEHTLRVSMLVAAALAAAAVLRSGSAALRHWLLAVALAGAAAMPLLAIVAPSWHVAMPSGHRSSPGSAAPAVSLTIMPQVPAAGHLTAEAARQGAAHALRVPGIAVLAVALWIGGTAVSVALIAAGFVRLRRVGARAHPSGQGRLVDEANALARAVGIDRPIAILEGGDPALVITWGAARPKILLPSAARGWPDDRLRIVLRHELAHIRRGDWLAQIVGEIARAVNWFNPVVWIACARLRRESEHACDDAVIAAGIDPADYAAQLVDLARALNKRRPVGLPAPAMARLSTLEGRVSAMLNHHLDRRPITRTTQLSTAVVLMLLTIAIAGVAGQRYSKFSGVVLDQTNAYLPDVTMSLTSAGSQARHEVRTDRSGRFEFVGLPDGDYTLSALQAGFAPLSEPITISGRDLDRTIQLHIGTLHETISVTAGPGPARPYDPDLRQKARQWAEDKSREVAQRCAGAAAGGMGGNILQPMKIADVKPRYPERLQAAGTGGVVTLEALIGTDGTIRDVRVVKSADPDLDRAAMDAVRQWEFSSTILNCTPVEVSMGITVNFVGRN